MAGLIDNSGVSDEIEIVVKDKFGNIKDTRKIGRKVSQLEKLMLAEANADLYFAEVKLKGSELRWN